VSPPGDIRLLLTDVDGTLVTTDKQLTDAARAAARALRARGIALAVTSSRPPRGLRMLVRPLDLRLPMAGCNGAVLVNPNLSVIETRFLAAATARKTIDFLLGRGLDVWVYTRARWLVRDPDGPHVAREAWILRFKPAVVAAFTDADLAEAVKIVGVSDDHDLVAASEAAAPAVLGEAASATRSAAHFLDVTNPLANKGEVVATLVRRLNIPAERIATIGDMPNDVLMFARSGFSIAMGNASDAVKSRATAVTDSNDEDGFAKAVTRFLLQPNGVPRV
jgi:Cof subfamily protein (haloacid dehalogenase superfamily)